MTYWLGLTGSIGMGKTTTAAIFAGLGHPVWDADAAVARLYARGAAGHAAIGAVWPEAAGAEGVDRAVLRRLVAEDAAVLKTLDAIVHPLVAGDRAAFRASVVASGAPLAVLDIPLLFETGAEAEMDGVAVVSTDADTQRQRVLARGTAPEVLDAILARQMPDAEKRRRATWVIPTTTPDAARDAVIAICQQILADPEARHA